MYIDIVIYIYICINIHGCELKRLGIEQVLVDILFNTPFNTLLNTRVPIVQNPPFNTPFNTLFNTLVQYPCSISLFVMPVLGLVGRHSQALIAK